MEKLIRYYANKGKLQQQIVGDNKEDQDFPDLTAAEEAEVITELELTKAVERSKTKKSAKDLITGTLRSFKEYRPTENEVDVEDDENDFEVFGTVRIKKTNGTNSFGTLRVKKDPSGTPILKIFEAPELNDGENQDDEENDFSTFKVNKGGQDRRDEDRDNEDEDGDENIDYSTFQVDSSLQKKKETLEQIQRTSKFFIYRKPEDWEMNIIALEKGEWVQGMEEKKKLFANIKKKDRS